MSKWNKRAKHKREECIEAVESLKMVKVFETVVWCKPSESQLLWHQVKVNRVYVLGDRAFAVCPLHKCEIEVILKKAIQK